MRTVNRSRSVGWLAILAMCCVFLAPWAGYGRTVDANPSNYKSLLGSLVPGDTMRLASGTYVRLTLQDIHGTADAWIIITGPNTGSPAIIEPQSGYNTVQFYGCSYLGVKNLTIDGKDLGMDGFNAKDYISHHILIENCHLHHIGTGQQIVGISTKSTAWNWIIRNNLIEGTGTGLYLGNSNGMAPFIGGTIEGNCVLTPIGYCMQIKYQLGYNRVAEMAAGPNTTIIRHNVFIKDDRPSPDGWRPNLLVDGFPDTGTGSQDHYEIYGNFLYNNPNEALFQGSGRISFHDNILVNPTNSALVLSPHDGKVIQEAYIYNNTIYSPSTGIRFSGSATVNDGVVGNLIFAATPIAGTVKNPAGNLTDSTKNALKYVTRPSMVLDSMDFYPLPGKCEGAALDLSAFADDVEYDRDFNGVSKGGFTFRGAYAGSGANPGWKLAAERKSVPGLSTDDRGLGDVRASGHRVLTRILVLDPLGRLLYRGEGGAFGSSSPWKMQAAGIVVLPGDRKGIRIAR